MLKKVIVRVATQRDFIIRGIYKQNISRFNLEDLMFVNESVASKKTLFRRTYQLAINMLAFIELVLRHLTRYLVLLALTINGFLNATLIVKGSITQAIYNDQLENQLLPQIRRKVLVIDNCLTHYLEHIKRLYEHARVTLVYLPLYSPNYNPIKLTFYLLK